ncbi:MAG: hypothetical protein WCX91_05890 [Candidatus Omnitrophota bacterium]|jgi:hypothetical protein
MRLNRLVPVFLILLLCGCATTPYSIPLSHKAKAQSPGKGIPYYLPHPYLVVTKNLTFVATEKPESTANQAAGKTTTENTNKNSDKNDNPTKNDTALNKDAYAMQVIYLPDADQKYALYYNRGTGTCDSIVTLVDGWKLAGLNTKSDAQTAEIIKAVGSALKDTASAATSVATGIPVSKGAMPGMDEDVVTPSVSTETINVGIWIYDLMGDIPFRCVFSWEK